MGRGLLNRWAERELKTIRSQHRVESRYEKVKGDKFKAKGDKFKVERETVLRRWKT